MAAHSLDASAQDATLASVEIPRTGHPLVGAWQVNEGDGHYAPTGYAVFDADGTWLRYSSPFLAIGVWRPTGESTAEGVEIYERPQEFERLLALASPVPTDALEQQGIKFRFNAEVAADGNAFKTQGFVVDDQGDDLPSHWGEIAGVRLAPTAGAATPTA